jgi:hypothetical protein
VEELRLGWLGKSASRTEENSRSGEKFISLLMISSESPEISLMRYLHHYHSSKTKNALFSHLISSVAENAS